MKFGIIAAMPQELKLLADALQQPSTEEVAGKTYYSGRLGKHDVVLVESGIGKVMSAISVAILVDHFAVDALINTGSAGAVADGIAVGDVVISDRLAYHDVDVTAFGYAYGQMAGQDLYFEAEPLFLEKMAQVLAAHELTVHRGLIVTGDSFIASSQKVAEIKIHFPAVLAVEMEGAAVAQAAKNLGKPFLVIRAMSDTAQGDAHLSFDDFIVQAGQRSAAVLIQFLEEYEENRV